MVWDGLVSLEKGFDLGIFWDFIKFGFWGFWGLMCLKFFFIEIIDKLGLCWDYDGFNMK